MCRLCCGPSLAHMFRCSAERINPCRNLLSLIWLCFIRSGCCFGWCRAGQVRWMQTLGLAKYSYATITEHTPSHSSLVGFCSFDAAIRESEVLMKIRSSVTGLLLFTGQVNNNTPRVDKGRSALTGHSICWTELINHLRSARRCSATTNTCV